MSRIQDIFDQLGVVQKGHFVGTSGKHLDTYINKNILYLHPEIISEVCQEMSKAVPPNVDVIIGPPTGGIVLSQWVAYHTSKHLGREVLSVYTDKVEDGQTFRAPYDEVVRGKRAYIVDDIVTTGGSVQEVCRTVEGAGAEIVGIGVLVNRSPQTVGSEAFRVPFSSLFEIELHSYDENEIPPELASIPVTTKMKRE